MGLAEPPCRCRGQVSSCVLNFLARRRMSTHVFAHSGHFEFKEYVAHANGQIDALITRQVALQKALRLLFLLIGQIAGNWVGYATGTARALYALTADGGCAFYGSEAYGEGRGAGRALLFSPDNWHSASLRLYCGSGPRRDLSEYDALQFYMRLRGSGTGTVPNLQLASWDQHRCACDYKFVRS